MRDLAREPKFGVSPAEDEFTQARPKWKTFAQRQPHTAQLASAVRLYGHLSLRGFGDLDIVICERDALRVRHVLIDGGYAPGRVDTSELNQYLRENHEMQFCRADGKVRFAEDQ